MSSVTLPQSASAPPRSVAPSLATTAERVRYLSTLSLFADLPPRTIERIARQAHALRLPRHALLFEHGARPTGFWTVVAGRVQLLLPAEGGGEKLLSGHGPGSSFGEAEMFGDTPYAVDCRAIEDTVLLFVPSVAVLPALGRCGELAQRFLRDISNRMHGLVRDIAQYTQKSAESRIASLLLQLADAAPERSADGPRNGATPVLGDDPAALVLPQPQTVRLPDRKRAIASRLSVAPETFSRALRTFQDDGLIRVDGYRVQILDTQRLMAAARD